MGPGGRRLDAVQGPVEGAVGDLTDDDLTRIAGKRQQLVGCLQERYRLSETQAEEAIAAFESENP